MEEIMYIELKGAVWYIHASVILVSQSKMVKPHEIDTPEDGLIKH